MRSLLTGCINPRRGARLRLRSWRMSDVMVVTLEAFRGHPGPGQGGGIAQWMPTIPAQTQLPAPAPPFQIREATASCSALLARYAAGPVPPNPAHVLGMIW